jgi:hypothetical protein
MTRTILSLGVALATCQLGVAAGERVEHLLVVGLDPATHRLTVDDTLSLPEASFENGGVEFLLNGALEITESRPQVELIETIETGESVVLGGETLEREAKALLKRYRLASIPEDGQLILAYEGSFDFGLSDQKEEYTRGFRETVGILGEEGVYLSAGGFWYPYFGDELVDFDMEVSQPEGWHVISEGRGSSRDESGRARWESEGPADEIYLTGGALTVYRETAGAVEALVYLREQDDALASKYLTATAQYLEMYRELIGPYPYSKFALVENFWETGYGMPSFTLLGPRVIRFPFILHSSYPHEILHNWWGNSVFVDYATGNWCEGLTAYMADHLIQEQRGKGETYRRDTLQKYRNYVKEERDFPLEEFRSRHSAATEAVGYGKSLMGFHMLRRELGDEKFAAALAGFYRKNRGRQASFRDLQGSFEATAEVELGAFFDQWLQRTGAPSLSVDVNDVREEAGGYVVRGTLSQIQEGEPFSVAVPIVVDTAGGSSVEIVKMAGQTAEFSLSTSERPVLLRVDPQFDLFRLLDPRETPPSIGQLFGEASILAVLPSAAGAERLEGYKKLMEGWQSDSHSIEIKLDSEVNELPADRSVWILGEQNRHAERLFAGGEVAGLEVGEDRVEMAGEDVDIEEHSWIAIRRHPGDVEKAVGWLVVAPPAAFEGMGRKLPHYGKYSYLAFEGDAPDNVVKGQWSSTDSPLTVDLRPADTRDDGLEIASLAPREPLAELPPVFSEKALAEHVAYLSSTELEGRGIGSEGLSEAAAYIVERFEAAGLSPGGDNGTYYQTFTVAEGPDGEPREVSNIIGFIPGAREDWKDQSVILCAHYDHLGRGWPDVHKGDEGKIHPGADDNASGVAVLLELAKNYAEAEAPERSLVFAAFTGEEAGRLGSRYFVEHPGRFAPAGMRAVINLDTVGRLFDGRVSALGTGTADEWQHIFRGVSFVTGVDSRNVPESAEASDQMSFIAEGIPAVQIFTEAHADYHRPTDTADKVDSAGLVKIATFVKEATNYLVQREEPLTITIAGKVQGERPRAESGGRKVLFGTVPEFAYQGPGAQVASVVPGSPAEKAGIQAGDVLIRIDEVEIADLRGFSGVLRTLEPGQTVVATVLRNGEELTTTVTVEAR